MGIEALDVPLKSMLQNFDISFIDGGVPATIVVDLYSNEPEPSYSYLKANSIEHAGQQGSDIILHHPLNRLSQMSFLIPLPNMSSLQFLLTQ